jgi:hypothetical protein
MTRGTPALVPLFDMPAEGEMFDTRPFDDPMPKVPVGGLPVPASWRCPCCGRMNETSPGAPCFRCERAGHEALTMEVE